ncbi:RNA polymerase sigma factor [Fulvivirgaceae bacterium BMA10]|uniref:RNA polymerase sigma factor n=1 Tax=Splendidivirga corallicola TaxID=3051826 RepID=A0ABT8KVF5_9BACT|nr:RNA polymerase sigma factor [Fulvivirgaceae bacterium BMA10]
MSFEIEKYPLSQESKTLLQETALLKSLREQDPNAFKNLVETFQDKVFNTCFGFLHNSEDAEDMAQETFVEIYQSIDKFRGEAQLSTWIYRIAVTKSLEYLRRKKRKKRFGFLQPIFSNEEVEQVNKLSDFQHPGISLENKERSQILFAAIDTLAENQKIAFTLHKVEGLSHEKISEIMDLSISSIESLMFRAKKNLQKRLENYYKSS